MTVITQSLCLFHPTEKCSFNLLCVLDPFSHRLSDNNIHFNVTC